MTTTASIQLATAILKSAHAHEASFVCTPDPIPGVFTPGFYKLNLHNAASQESGDLAEPVHLMLTSHWNEAICWAETVLGVLGHTDEQRGQYLAGVEGL